VQITFFYQILFKDRILKMLNPVVKSKSDSGFIIITVVILLTIITSLAITIGHRASGHRTRAIYSLERIKTRHSGLSGLAIAQELILADNTNWDGYGDPWFNPISFTLGTIAVKIQIEDEQSRINVNNLLLTSDQINRPLMKVVNNLVPNRKDVSAMWRSNLINWYSDHGKGLIDPEISVHLLQPIVTDDFEKYLTWVGTGRININTASENMLEALGGNDFRKVILRNRNGNPIRSLFDSKDSENLYRGILSIVDVRTSYFRIHVSAQGRFVTSHIEALVYRQSNGVKIIRQKEWWS